MLRSLSSFLISFCIFRTFLFLPTKTIDRASEFNITLTTSALIFTLNKLLTILLSSLCSCFISACSTGTILTIFLFFSSSSPITKRIVLILFGKSLIKRVLLSFIVTTLAFLLVKWRILEATTSTLSCLILIA